MEFTISPEGFLSETRVQRSAETEADRWLLDSLALEANRMLVRAYKATVKVGEGTLARHGLSFPRAAVLAMLYRSPGRRLSIGEIAEAREVSSPGISKLVDGLESRGWVTRVENPEDGRSNLVQLTDAGASCAEEMLPAFYEPLNDLWSALTDEEKRVIIHLLAKLRIRASARMITSSDVTPSLRSAP